MPHECEGSVVAVDKQRSGLMGAASEWVDIPDTVSS